MTEDDLRSRPRAPRGERGARAALVAIAAGLLAAVSLVDLPQLASGRFWSDGATYYSMAWSLASDGDLRYEARDLERVRKEYPSGPDGVFLKRASGGLVVDRALGFPWLRRAKPEEKRLYYAKAMLYPLLSAPLVAVAGTRGLLILNALALAVALSLGYDVLRRRVRPWAALAAVAVLFFGSVAPVYLFWPQPEMLNLALVAAALWAWARGRPGLAAALFGLAVYSKPTHVLLALPLGGAPFLESPRAPFAAALRESLRRGAWMALTAGLLFAANALITGEANYQGGERKTFLTHFPFESPTVTFGNSGIWMTTEHIGPQTADASTSGRAERGRIVRDRSELRETFLRNLAYFWVGRYAGVVPYFFPFAVFLAGFLLVGPRSREGWLAVAALCLSWLAFIALIPDNWYGGGGTVGNRYFLSLLPLGVFLVPGRRSLAWLAVAGVGATFLSVPVLRDPVRHSIEPWWNAQRASVRLFPLELTMLNDLGFCSDPWRKKQPFGDPEGDPRAGRAPDPRSYWLYFADDGTYGREIVDGAEGFWLRRDHSAEVVLRTHHPVRSLVVRLRGGPAGDIVRTGGGRGGSTLLLAPFQQGETTLEPGRGYRYYGTWIYVLSLASTGHDTGAAVDDPRSLGAFVRLELRLETDAAG
jgi:hypothetical protein